MKIGYPCINLSLNCRSSSTFRLRSYSDERLIQTVSSNLECLLQILDYNARHGLLFFRITSDLVPFASHPVCRYDWAAHFGEKLAEIGAFIRMQRMRISMHPDQFTLLNSPDERVLQNSLAELDYHALILDLMGLDESAKIQIHVGGVYGEKEIAINRLIQRYKQLPVNIGRRLVIENDDRHYSLRDCLKISAQTGVPILFDAFHHSLLNHDESISEALSLAASTWESKDGIPMVDYSSQKPGARSGSHTDSLQADDFRGFLKSSRPLDSDLMLEIKDKEKSALKALQLASRDSRVQKNHRFSEARTRGARAA
jgi:UV DNA damage endonuclease